MGMAEYTFDRTTYHYDPTLFRVVGNTIYILQSDTTGATYGTITLEYERTMSFPETSAEARARRKAEHRRACQQHFAHGRWAPDPKPPRSTQIGYRATQIGYRGQRRLVPGPASRQPRRPD